MPKDKEPTQLSGDLHSTRVRLILTAERLFAERGISAVSLREIGAAAGQRNTSAAIYHFGTKQALVEAVLAYRMVTINDRRLEMLATMQVAGRQNDTRSLLEAFVYPLATSVAASRGNYGRFLAQMDTDPGFETTYNWEAATSLRLVTQGLRRTLAGLPEPLIDQRIRMLRHLVLHTVADHDPGHGVTDAGPPAWAIHLVDAAEGLLTAPTRVAADPTSVELRAHGPGRRLQGGT